MSLLAVALIAALIPGTALASPIPTSTSYSAQHVWTVSNINHAESAAWNEIWYEPSTPAVTLAARATSLSQSVVPEPTVLLGLEPDTVYRIPWSPSKTLAARATLSSQSVLPEPTLLLGLKPDTVHWSPLEYESNHDSRSEDMLPADSAMCLGATDDNVVYPLGEGHALMCGPNRPELAGAGPRATQKRHLLPTSVPVPFESDHLYQETVVDHLDKLGLGTLLDDEEKENAAVDSDPHQRKRFEPFTWWNGLLGSYCSIGDDGLFCPPYNGDERRSLPDWKTMDPRVIESAIQGHRVETAATSMRLDHPRDLAEVEDVKQILKAAKEPKTISSNSDTTDGDKHDTPSPLIDVPPSSNWQPWMGVGPAISSESSESETPSPAHNRPKEKVAGDDGKESDLTESFLSHHFLCHNWLCKLTTGRFWNGWPV